MWVFGYGSLIWRPDLPFDARMQGYIKGWSRRFYQGSTDHRGVPGRPGRVVTLIDSPGSRTHGVAFHIPDASRQDVLKQLDHREQGGYERDEALMYAEDGQEISVLVYRATPDNPEFLGPAPAQEIAAQILNSSGPSGPNSEYLLKLAAALRLMNVEDVHTFDIERHLLGMLTPIR